MRISSKVYLGKSFSDVKNWTVPWFFSTLSSGTYSLQCFPSFPNPPQYKATIFKIPRNLYVSHYFKSLQKDQEVPELVIYETA